MRIVITGAAGHLGGLASAALSAHDLILVDRRRIGDPRGIAVNLARAPTPWSRFRWRGWDRLFRGADVVMHLAGAPSPNGPWAQVRRHNIEATWHVLEAAAAHAVPKVVFASSSWAIRAEERERRASGDGRLIGSEVPPRPITAYGAAKAFGEIAGRMFVDEGRLRTFIAMRIGYCPPDGRYPAGDVLAPLWIGREDAAQFLRRCVEAEVEGFHVVYGVSVVSDCPFDLGPTSRLLAWTPVEIGACAPSSRETDPVPGALSRGVTRPSGSSGA